MLTETSFQAQFLVPMATSIAFGLMLSTVVVLFQVPVFFQIYLIVSHWLGFDQSKSRTEKIAELVGDSLIAEAAS